MSALSLHVRQAATRLAEVLARLSSTRPEELSVRSVNPAILGINMGPGADDAAAATLLLDGAEVNFGVPVERSALNKLVRRVIISATALAAFYVCYFIFSLLRSCPLGHVQETGKCQGSVHTSGSSDDPTSLWAAVSSLLIELSIPACGYFGALYNNRQMTCCFCSCNLFISILSAITMIRTNVHVSGIDGQCDREQNAQNRRMCEIWASDGLDKYVMIFHNVVVISMGCLAFWFGNKLYNRMAHDTSLSHTFVVGEAISISDLRDMVELPNGARAEQGAGDAGAVDPRPAAERR